MIAECKQVFKVACRWCGSVHELSIAPSDFARWYKGQFIQDAMPYLTAEERVLLISRTCNDCWEKMFGKDEDFEE